MTDPGDIRFSVGGIQVFVTVIQFHSNGDGAAPVDTSAVATGSDVIGYQWQSSTDGANWGDIDGATSADYDDGPTVYTTTTSFRRIAFT